MGLQLEKEKIGFAKMFTDFTTYSLKHAYRLPSIHDKIFMLTFILTEFGVILAHLLE